MSVLIQAGKHGAFAPAFAIFRPPAVDPDDATTPLSIPE
jgi:hypothetical protein